MKHSTLLRLIVAFHIIGVSAGAGASPIINTPIRELWANSEISQNVIWLKGETTFASTCGVTSAYLVMDLAEPGMKEAYAMALAAFLSGRNIRIQGAGSCFGQYEKVKYILLIQ